MDVKCSEHIYENLGLHYLLLFSMFNPSDISLPSCPMKEKIDFIPPEKYLT